MNNNTQDDPKVIDDILESKKNFERKQKIIFILSFIVFLFALSHIVTDVFLH
ncbi:MAG: hypothetical protein ACW981_11405 [Candidatus Hodarchaeales archaeon]|jgi:hypothetical protein